MTASQWFAVGGGVLQIGGFVAVIMASTAELVRDYKDSGFFMRQVLRLRDFVVYWFGTLPPPIIASDSAHGSVRFTGSGTGRTSPESTLERVERELRELRSEFERFKEDASGRFSTIEQSLAAVEQQVVERMDQLQQRLDAIRHGALKKERRGAWAFVIGTALVLVSAFA